MARVKRMERVVAFDKAAGGPSVSIVFIYLFL